MFPTLISVQRRGHRYVIAVMALLLPLMVVGQQTNGELRLEIRDPSGAGMEANGRLQGPGLDRSFQADAQGISSVTSIPTGSYRLTISKDGFATHSELIDVPSGEPVTRIITLPLSAAAFAIEVSSTTPLPGVDLASADVAAPIQTITSRDLESSGALDLSDLLNRRLNGVYINEVQGNPVQPDVNYRGYTASPLLGTPQGVSVYMDGVRLNQPFGDVVSWDLIPRIAISETTLIPGSNPLFGLNTLGGALSIRTKDGYSNPGTTLQLGGGSFGRKTADFEHGGFNSNGLSWYVAGNMFFEDGWRQTSPSNVRQILGKLGWQRARTTLSLTTAYANNSLNGNGLQELRFLNQDYTGIYTKPDTIRDRSPFVNFSMQHAAASAVTFSGNVYYRYIRANSLNADINEASLDQSVYQPNAAERAALAAAGYTGFPGSGETAANTPFPFWRCIANVLLNDEPAEKCNALINRTRSQQRNYGASGQVTWRSSGFRSGTSAKNQFTIGSAYDRSNVDFAQSSELGYLNADRSVTGLAAFGDGISGGVVDGEPYDTQVDLHGRISTGSVYATNTLSAGSAWSVTLSGRYNRTTIDNRDRIRPEAGSGSLTGHDVFDRFNPAVGVTFHPVQAWNAYASYSEGSRAPASVELGCADSTQPCKLPNAMAGDPPLKQVVTRTIEAGIRSGTESTLRWSAGWFRSENRNDILFVASPQTGFGYFKNFGKTRRQGVQLDASTRIRRATIGAGYTFLDATFQTSEQVNGSGNSSNEDALTGIPGLEGNIQILPGNHIPLIPQHMLKVYADVQLTSKLLLDASVIGASSSYARGNENNLHQPDDTYYLGPGTSPGYAVASLGARYQFSRRVQLFAQINNLFNRRYYTAAQIGPTGFTGTGAFVARPFAAATSGDFPVRQSTFYAPGAPIGAWGGVRISF